MQRRTYKKNAVVSVVKIILPLVFCAGAASGETPEKTGIALSGVSQNDLLALQTPLPGSRTGERFDFAGANLLTLDLRSTKASAATVEGSFDFWLLSGAYADAYRAMDSSGILPLPQSSSVLYVDIRKLYASLDFSVADVSVGRQIISFGRGLVFSPVDVFSSINLSDLAFRRRGSDVLRVRVPFGTLSGADVIASLASRAEGKTVAAKTYTNVAGWDIAGVGIYKEKSREEIAGLTFKGDFVAGLYGELVEHWLSDSAHFFRGMAGADYSLSSTWFFTAEYLLNEKRTDLTALTPLAAGELDMPYTGRQYLFASVRYVVNELLWFSLSGIGALEEKAGFLTAQCGDNVLQNADVTFFARYLRGDLLPVMKTVSPEFEYGVRVTVAF